MALTGAIVCLLPTVGVVSWLLCPVGLVLCIAGIRISSRGGTGRTAAWTGVLLAVFGLVMCSTTTPSLTRTASSAPTSAPSYAAPSYPSYSYPSYSSPSYTTPSYAPPSYSYPSYSPTPSAPVSTAPVAPRTFRGSGDDVVSIDNQPGAYVLTFSCPRCSGNTVLRSDGSEGLLVNTIGSYAGKRWIDLRDGSTTSQLTVRATGAWTITVGGLDQATQASGPVSGTGDDVVLLSGNTSIADVTNRGSSNFAVHVLSGSSSRIDLAVNEIGSYRGTISLRAPALVQVTSSGRWTITPR